MSADVPDPDAVDAEDVAEAFDETHYSEDGENVVDPDLFDEAYDDTQKLGDADDGDALALDEAEFDPDALDEDDEDDDLEPPLDEFQPEDNDLDDDDNAEVDGLEETDIEGLEIVADADLVEGGEDDFTNFQSRRVSDEDLAALGYDDARRFARPAAAADGKAGRADDQPDPHIEKTLDEALEETFPASDPVSISSGSD